MSSTVLRNRRRVAAVGLACLLAGTAAATGAGAARADDDLKQKQRRVERSLHGARDDLHESSREALTAHRRLERARSVLVDAQRRLSETRVELAAAQERDRQLQERLEQAQARLERARERLSRTRREAQSQRGAIAQLATANFQSEDPDLMRLLVLFSAQTPRATTTQMEAVDSLASRQDRVLDELKALRSRLITHEAEVEDATAQVGAERDAAAQNLAVVQQLEGEAAQARTEVADLVGRRRDANAAAAATQASDKRKLDALKQENDRIGEMLRARAAAAARAAARARARGQSGSSSSGGGALIRPVDGYVTSPYGYRVHPIYGYYGLHDGTDFHAPCGTPLRAVASGTVVDAYYSDVWGNRVVLDVGRVAGRNVAVIYNHLSRTAVGDGTHVSQGQTVGYSGTTGWSTACHLHFTLMADGKPVDPMPWF